jgi:hypothetical protein
MPDVSYFNSLLSLISSEQTKYAMQASIQNYQNGRISLQDLTNNFINVNPDIFNIASQQGITTTDSSITNSFSSTSTGTLAATVGNAELSNYPTTSGGNTPELSISQVLFNLVSCLKLAHQATSSGCISIGSPAGSGISSNACTNSDWSIWQTTLNACLSGFATTTISSGTAITLGVSPTTTTYTGPGSGPNFAAYTDDTITTPTYLGIPLYYHYD